MSNAVSKKFGRNVVSLFSNGLVQIETRDAVVTVPGAQWDACLEAVANEYDGLTEAQMVERAALVAERTPKAIVVRF